MDKYLIALSGGVDSSVAARLMQETGAECVGATLLLHEGSGEGCESAMAVARQLELPFCAFPAQEEFRAHVMGPFCRSYLGGATPNPCIRCNRYLKFGLLLDKARQLGCSHVVTGHYARVEYHAPTGRWLLRKAVDEAKDQSYFLACLSQKQLSACKFPLGEMTKGEIRALAAGYGLVTAQKKDSQDICFIPDGDYVSFLKEFTGMELPAGDFVDGEGKILGRHEGLACYTVGQRRGLGIAWEHPLYVTELSPLDNPVRRGKNEDLFTSRLQAGDVNLVALSSLSHPVRCMAKIRYRHTPAPAKAWVEGETLFVEFQEPQRAVTKGQTVVLYHDDLVLASGIIC